MIEKQRRTDGAREREQVRGHVIDGSNKASVEHVGDGDYQPASERDGQQETNHSRTVLFIPL